MDFTLLQQDLIRDEGIKYSAYTDSLGFLTIGVGRLIDSRKGGRISPDEVSLLLSNDIQQCFQDIQNEPWFLGLQTDGQRRGILNMRFQLGSRGLRTFNDFLSLLTQGSFKEAADDLRRTRYYQQVPQRAERICQLIEHV